MPRVKNSGKTQQFRFHPSGGHWQWYAFNGIDVWVSARRTYVRYSPRHVAVARAMKEFWKQNLGTQFKWEKTLDSLHFYLEARPHVRLSLSRNDYTKGREIIRELGADYLPDGTRFVYASTRGSNAVAGFIEEQGDAVEYEVRNHRILRVMEGRVATGTVEPAGHVFGIPVKTGKIKTRQLR